MVERYAAALFGFAFVATAVGAGVGTALLALAGAAAAYVVASLRQRRRLDRHAEDFLRERRPERGERRRSRRAA